MPAGRRQRFDKTIHQRKFLASFAACGSITRAARWAKIDRQTHHAWLKQDPTYPERFAEAQRMALTALEDEMIRRGHEGLQKAVRYKGKIVGYETEYSDRLLELAIKGNAPEKYRGEKDGSPPAVGGVNLTLIIQMIMQELSDAPMELRARLGERLKALSESAE